MRRVSVTHYVTPCDAHRSRGSTTPTSCFEILIPVKKIGQQTIFVTVTVFIVTFPFILTWPFGNKVTFKGAHACCTHLSNRFTRFCWPASGCPTGDDHNNDASTHARTPYVWTKVEKWHAIIRFKPDVKQHILAAKVDAAEPMMPHVMILRVPRRVMNEVDEILRAPTLEHCATGAGKSKHHIGEQSAKRRHWRCLDEDVVQEVAQCLFAVMVSQVPWHKVLRVPKIGQRARTMCPAVCKVEEEVLRKVPHNPTHERQHRHREQPAKCKGERTSNRDAEQNLSCNAGVVTHSWCKVCWQ
jgi:hypothetical protein